MEIEMKKLKRKIIEEYRYNSEEERAEHIIEMESKGYVCDGQAKRTDDCLMSNEKPEYYWFGRFYKYD